METSNKNDNTLVGILFFALLLFLIQLIQWIFRLDLGSFGIYPRTLHGLFKILTSPLIHADFGHLSSNLMALSIGLYILFSFYKNLAWEVFGWIWIAGGFFVWLFARENYHVGSSGLIYGINFFIITDSIIHRNIKTIALSLVILLMNQGMLWGLVPLNTQISWEGHLYSAMVGVVLAIALKDEIQEQLNPPDDMPEHEDTVPEELWNFQQYYHDQKGIDE